jgi:hypothetical protein
MSLFAQLDVSTSPAPQTDFNKAKAESKVFSPGLHEVKITEVTNHGPSKQDPSWLYLTLKSVDVSGIKKLPLSLMVPTQSLVCAKDDKGINEAKLRSFLRALGLSVETPAEFLRAIKNTFEAESKLVGKTLQVQLGYKSWHTGWDREAKKVTLVDRNGESLKDTQGGLIHFDGRDDAEAYARENGMKFNSFVEVERYIAKEKSASKAVGFGSK